MIILVMSFSVCFSIKNFIIFFELISDAPTIQLSFRYNGTPQKLSLKLPLTINKFFEPTEMNGESFFARWKNLGG